MPSGVFPVFGDYGFKKNIDPNTFVRVNEDNDVRIYEKAPNQLEDWEIKITSISQTDRDAVESFIVAHRTTSFYIYDPWYAAAPDLTGASSTGRRVGVFVPPQRSWELSGPCRYSTTVRVAIVG